MNPILKRKTEETLAAYLRPMFEGSGVNVLAGKNQSKKELPCIIVYASGIKPHPQFPDDYGICTVSVSVNVLTNAYDENMDEHDARSVLVMETLENDEALKAHVNVQDPDNRQVKDYHLYDLNLVSGDEGMKDDVFGETFNYEATCQGVDGAA